MNYFIKSLWFGALLAPKCWVCAFRRNPMMVALYAAVIFFIISFFNEVFFGSAVSLFVCWLWGMVLCIIIPRRRYKLQSNGKELHLFFYDACTKWKIDVNNDSRDAILRVFEKNEKGWRKLGENTIVKGYDGTLAASGFILVRLPYAGWTLLGNGYDMEKNVCILGCKIAEYAFILGGKNLRLYFIHGSKIVTMDILSCEKCNDVILSSPYSYYKKAEDDDPNLRTPPESTAEWKSGHFLLAQKEDGLHLFKAITFDGISSVYEIFTNWFNIHKQGQTRVFFKNPKGTYSLSKKITA